MTPASPQPPSALPKPKRRTVTEWRVTSEREGGQVSVKKYRSMKAVVNRIGRLVSDEPWRFYGDRQTSLKAPDDYVCCRGGVYEECGCGGETMRSQTAAIREKLPKIIAIRVESRQITYSGWDAYDAKPLVEKMEPQHVHA